MALTKNMDKSKIGLSFLRDQTLERERGRKRKREKKNKKRRIREEKKREEEAKPKRYGTTWNSKVLYEFTCLDG